MNEHFEILFQKASAELADLNSRVSSCSAAGRVVVTGAGNPAADIFVLKYVPDTDESASGTAFAGKSGQVLIKSAERLGLDCRVVFGTNLRKCGATQPDCATECRDFLFEELAVVEPRLVLAMGEPAFAAARDALGHEADYVPGGVVRRAGRATLVATVDFDLAMSDESAKKQLWQDFKLVGAEYAGG